MANKEPRIWTRYPKTTMGLLIGAWLTAVTGAGIVIVMSPDNSDQNRKIAKHRLQKQQVIATYDVY